MRGWFASAACLATFVAFPCSQAVADVLAVPTPTPAWTKTVGIMRVEKYGAGTPALILIPGLSCGSWVWNNTIAREAKSHAVYAVTLAGFDGLPYAPSANLDAADASIATLISTEQLDRPVLIGHSLGGYLALRFGTEHPAQLRGDVSADGLPVFPPLAQAKPEDLVAAGEHFAATVEPQTREQYEAAAGQQMRDYVTDPALAAHATTLALRSDKKAVVTYGKQLFVSDLRAQLPKLTVPTLLVAPVPGIPLPSYLPPEMAKMPLEQRRTSTVAFYRSLMAGAPSVTVVPVDNARHFVMLDQPDAFASAIDAFIASLK